MGSNSWLSCSWRCLSLSVSSFYTSCSLFFLFFYFSLLFCNTNQPLLGLLLQSGEMFSKTSTWVEMINMSYIPLNRNERNNFNPMLFLCTFMWVTREYRFRVGLWFAIKHTWISFKPHVSVCSRLYGPRCTNAQYYPGRGDFHGDTQCRSARPDTVAVFQSTTPGDHKHLCRCPSHSVVCLISLVFRCIGFPDDITTQCVDQDNLCGPRFPDIFQRPNKRKSPHFDQPTRFYTNTSR
jgi:hypothetical protein